MGSLSKDIFFYHNPLPIWLCDPETTRIIEINDAAVNAFGFSTKECLAFRLDNMLTPFPNHNSLHSRALQIKGKGGDQYKVDVSVDQGLYQGRLVKFVIGYNIHTEFAFSDDFLSTHNISKAVLDASKVEESEERFRILVQDLSVGIVVQNANAEITFANQSISTLLGLTTDQLKGKFSFDKACRLVREDGSPLPDHEHPSTIAIATGKRVSNHIIGVDRESFNDLIWMMVDAVPVLDDQHNVKSVTLTCIDITARVLAERSLRESEARYRSIVHDQREMICRYTRTGSLTFANKSYLDAFNVTDDDVEASNFLDQFAADTKSFGASLIAAVFDDKRTLQPVEITTTIKKKRHWLHWINIPLRNEDGEVYEVQAIGQDITARKNLEIQQARLDKIVTESYNEIYLFNASSLQFEFANTSALKNLGYALNQLTKMKITDLFYYPNEMALKILLKTLQTGETDRLQLKMKHRRKDGSYYDIETLIQLLEKDNSFVAIATDITEKLVTEEKLLSNIQEKEMLIKEIHHRVKNNLQLISSIIYIKINSIKEREIQYFLEDMRQKIRSIALIHERLLQTQNLDTVEISDYLGKLIYDLQVSNRMPDLQLYIESEIDTLEIDLDTAIYCALIVNELITNAIKHAFHGFSTGIIKVQFKVSKNEYILSVGDNGITMPEGVGPGESTSFGMHLLEIFVKQLQGTIDIERNQGTTFNVRFESTKSL